MTDTGADIGRVHAEPCGRPRAALASPSTMRRRSTGLRRRPRRRRRRRPAASRSSTRCCIPITSSSTLRCVATGSARCRVGEIDLQLGTHPRQRAAQLVRRVADELLLASRRRTRSASSNEFIVRARRAISSSPSGSMTRAWRSAPLIRSTSARITSTGRSARPASHHTSSGEHERGERARRPRANARAGARSRRRRRGSPRRGSRRLLPGVSTRRLSRRNVASSVGAEIVRIWSPVRRVASRAGRAAERSHSAATHRRRRRRRPARCVSSSPRPVSTVGSRPAASCALISSALSDSVLIEVLRQASGATPTRSTRLTTRSTALTATAATQREAGAYGAQHHGPPSMR